MSDIAIRVENLSKKYQIGETLKRHDTLRDAVVDALRAPFARRPGNQAGDDAQTLWALKDVSFEVKRGEVVGIIGRNGAGKSTLLKILTRITEPTSGRAVLKGRVASLLEVGTGFHPELTGRENIYLNGAILGMQRHEIARKFDEIVAFAEIEKFLDTPVKRYSSGMYVRLAFAVAAHLEPEILLVDEVLAVGDAVFQKKCLGKMGDVASKGRTVLFVSHNMAAVSNLCPTTVYFDAGRVEFLGPTSLAVSTYLNKSVGKNIGEGPSGVFENVLNTQTTSDISITKIELLQIDRNPLPALGAENGLLVRLHYKAERTILAPGFIVMIYSSEGVELCRVSNMPISGYYIEKISGRGYVEVGFDDLPLTGGRYYLSIGVARANVEWLTRLDDVAWFDVAPKDAYGSGLAMDNQRGYMIVSHSWQIVPEIA